MIPLPSVKVLIPLYDKVETAQKHGCRTGVGVGGRVISVHTRTEMS